VDGNTTYAYDADGRRIGKVIASGFVAEYILDQDGRELAQLGVGGNLVRGEVYASGQHVATYNGLGLYFTFRNHLGTERIRRNADGSCCCGMLSFVASPISNARISMPQSVHTRGHGSPTSPNSQYWRSPIPLEAKSLR
jgi:hypothetical protein